MWIQHVKLTQTPSLDVRFSGCDDSCHSYNKRLDRYCHRSLLRSQSKLDKQFSSFLDGVLPNNAPEKYELVQVHIVARHGDRSPNNPYAVFGSSVFYECGLVENDQNVSWEGLRDFPHMQSLHYGTEKTHSVYHSLYPGANSRRCGMGKLTRIGYHQLRALGHMMNKNYAAALLDNFTGDLSTITESIYVQSTDYSRTLRSAAAFLLGFLPNQQKLRNVIVIHVSPGSLLQAHPPGTSLVYRACKRLASFQESQLKKSKYYETEKTQYHPRLEKLSSMFHLNTENLPIITSLFDSIATRGCHVKDSPLPCYQDNCMDYAFANKLFEFVDWTFGNRYTQQSAIVAMLPFLRHSLLGLMEEMVHKKRENPYRFILSVTHDTTMTQLLLALGIRLDKWMSYASRINFELWKTKGDINADEEAAYMIRVLFNGLPVTHRLAAWKMAKNNGLHEEFLPYKYWEDYIMTGKYRDIQSYNKVCGYSM